MNSPMPGSVTRPGVGGSGYEIRLVTILTITFGLAFFDRNAIYQLLPFLVPELHLTNTQVGFLSSVLSITWAVSGYLFGLISDRTGRHKTILVAAIVTFSLCSFLSGQAQSFATLLAARFLMGLSEGPLLPISQSMVVAEVAPARRGVLMGVMQTFGSNLLGNFAAPLIIVALATAYGWRSAFNLAGLPGLLMAIVVARYLRPPAPASGAGTGTVGGGHRATNLFALLATRNIWICLVISVLMIGWMVIAWTFLPLYYVRVAGFSPHEMSILMSLFGLSGMVCGFLVPRLSDRFGRSPVMAAALFLGGAVPVGALALTGSAPLLGVFVFVGWAASGAFPLFMATVPSESVDRHSTARAIALVMGAGEVLGGFAGPALAGRAADLMDLRAPLYILLGLSTLGALMALGLRETAPGRNTQPMAA
jgi:MFS transporter, ACS family, hexuronate transporter